MSSGGKFVDHLDQVMVPIYPLNWRKQTNTHARRCPRRHALPSPKRIRAASRNTISGCRHEPWKFKELRTRDMGTIHFPDNGAG